MMYTFLTFIKKAKISEINIISCSCPKNNTGYGILEKKITGYWDSQKICSGYWEWDLLFKPPICNFLSLFSQVCVFFTIVCHFFWLFITSLWLFTLVCDFLRLFFTSLWLYIFVTFFHYAVTFYHLNLHFYVSFTVACFEPPQVNIIVFGPGPTHSNHL